MEMPFGLWAWMGRRNQVLDGGPAATDRQTDRQTNIPCYSVGNNRPHLRT